MENSYLAQANFGGVKKMSKKNKQNKKQDQVEKGKKGFGDKKLIGENRPAE